ncbi:DNA polymerase III subunit beta [Shinella sp. NM-101]|uniref:DNA polymerase III subunit beta n=1 Tax=Shinella sp. NM-101 TaxID=2744455 RepID=UPI001F39FF3A|nr:DNA polymerase III subunit beta [Shinella sp. NM-101]
MTAAAIIIGREALLPALALAVRVVERRTTIPILSNVLIRAGANGDGGRLAITGTDLDAEIVVSRKCVIEGGAAEVTLPANNLHDIVRKLPEGCEVKIAGSVDAKDDGGMWTVSAGRSRFRLPALPASDFHELSAGEFACSFDMEAATLKAMLETVRFAISSEETRYYLNGIHWHEDVVDGAAALIAVATDGHRLAKATLPLPDGAGGLPAIIVPRKTVELVLKMLPEKGTVRLDVSDVKFRISMGGDENGVTLVSKLIDGTFPDYKRVVPAGNPNRYTLARAPLADAIDRVLTVSTGKGNAVKYAFARDGLTVTAHSPDAGSAEDQIEIAGADGDPVEIGFNGKYCLDLLSAAGGDEVIFELGDAGAPALIRPAQGGDTLFVLMPMRI